MDRDFWQARWDAGQIGFHEGRPNAHLERFVEELRHHAEPRVLVPLCGKSADLRFLAERGFQVTGVELVPEAVRAFFAESQLDPQEIRDGGLPCLAAGRIRVAIGDFFAWDPEQSEPIDAAYDRAALIAVRPEDRERYVGHLLGALRPGGRLLLVTFAYDPAAMTGPPFSVDAAEVRRLLEGRGTLTCLADDDILEREPRFRERGLTWLREQAWVLRVR
jgi:thiopurine S-methyltransferase